MTTIDELRTHLNNYTIVNDEAIHEDESRDVLNTSFCEAYINAIQNVQYLKNYADNNPPSTTRERIERAGLRILIELCNQMLKTINENWNCVEENLIEYNRLNQPVSINELLKLADDEVVKYDLISYIDTFRDVNDAVAEYNA